MTRDRVPAVPGLDPRLSSRGVTRREAEVLVLVGERRANDEIADQLFVSKRTVESHVSALLRKLGADDRRALAAVARSMAEPAEPELPAIMLNAVETSPLIGRDPELAQLTALLERSRRGEVISVLVIGEPGIGKSRVVAQLAAAARQHHAHVLLGTCNEDAQSPFEPIRAAVRSHLGTLPTDDRRARVPGLEPLLDPPGPHALAAARGFHEPVRAQPEVLAGLTDFLIACTSAGPVLFVVEDLHWATASTRTTLDHLMRWRAPAPVMVVATARDTRADLDDEAWRFLVDLQRAAEVVTVALDGLDAASVADLAELIADARPDDAHALSAACGGNPLFLREILETSHSGQRATPLRLLVSRRSASLDGHDQEILALAAVVGSVFDVRLVAAASGAGLDAVLEALDRIEAAGLVHALPGHGARWSFVHSLYQRYSYDAISTTRRLKLHAAVARALAARTHQLDRDASTLARHAYASHPIGDPEITTAACLTAGDEAAALLAVDEAIHFYRNALDVATSISPARQDLSSRAKIRLGSLLHNAGDQTGVKLLTEAAGEAADRNDGGALSEIAWSLSFYGSGQYGIVDANLARIVDTGLLMTGADDPDRALLLGLRAARHAFRGEMATVQVMCDEAVALARRAGDPVQLARVLTTIRVAVSTPDNLGQRLELARELESIGEQQGLRTLVVYALLGRASFLRESGDLEASSRSLDEALGHLGPTPPVWSAVLSTAMRANRHLLAGELTAAEDTLDELNDFASGQRSGVGALLDPDAWQPAHLCAIRRYQGRLGELVDYIDRHRRPLAWTADPLTTCALAHAGRHDEARRRLDHHSSTRFDQLPRNLTWLTSMTLLAEAAEMTHHEPAARLISTLLQPHAGRLDNFGDGTFGSIDLARAQVALVTGSGGTEPSQAVASAASTGSPVLRARAVIFQAASRRRSGKSHVGSDEAVQSALAFARRTGATLIADDASRLLGAR